MKTLKFTLLFALSLILVNCGDDKKKEEKETVKIGSNSSSSTSNCGPYQRKIDKAKKH